MRKRTDAYGSLVDVLAVTVRDGNVEGDCWQAGGIHLLTVENRLGICVFDHAGLDILLCKGAKRLLSRIVVNIHPNEVFPE